MQNYIFIYDHLIFVKWILKSVPDFLNNQQKFAQVALSYKK